MPILPLDKHELHGFPEDVIVATIETFHNVILGCKKSRNNVVKTLLLKVLLPHQTAGGLRSLM